MTMIGIVEDDIIVDQVQFPDVIDDFEIEQDKAVDIKDKEINKEKLRRRIRSTRFVPLTLSYSYNENWTYIKLVDLLRQYPSYYICFYLYASLEKLIEHIYGDNHSFVCAERMMVGFGNRGILSTIIKEE